MRWQWAHLVYLNITVRQSRNNQLWMVSYMCLTHLGHEKGITDLKFSMDKKELTGILIITELIKCKEDLKQ